MHQTNKSNHIALLVVSQSEKNINPEIVERLSRRGVSYKKTCSHLHEIAPMLKQFGKSILAIIEPNNVQLPKYLTYIMDQPLFLTTPIIFATENTESKIVSQISKIETLFATPISLNPSQFVSKIESCISWYSNNRNAALVKARSFLIEGKIRECLTVIAPKLKSNDIGSLASCLFYQLTRNSSGHNTSESVLLSAIQNNPTDLLTLLTVIDFYLRAGMPQTSLKLMNANKNKGRNNIFTLEHEFQANLMLNRLDSCIEILEDDKSSFENDQRYMDMLLKCMYSEGQSLKTSSSAHKLEQLDKIWQAQTSTQNKTA